MRTLLTILLAMAFSTTCLAEGHVVLKGRMGGSVIVMLLYCDSGRCSGTYFSTPGLKDNEFEGSRNKGSYELQVLEPAPDGNGRDTAATFFLTAGKGGKWTGRCIWSNKQASTVNLQQLPDSRQGSYSTQRRAQMKPVKQETETAGQLTYTWYTIDQTPVRYLHMDKGLATGAQEKINSTLKEMARQCAEEYFSCTFSYTNTDYAYSIDHVFINTSVVSVAVSGSYYCGNASIEDWYAGYNFNARTGAQLTLQDVIYLGPQAAYNDSYRPDKYTDQLTALLAGRYPAQMPPEQDDKRCNYASPEVWQCASWYFTPTGIFIRPWFRHFNMECTEETWSELPYATAAAHRNPAAKLTLPVGN